MSTLFPSILASGLTSAFNSMKRSVPESQPRTMSLDALSIAYVALEESFDGLFFSSATENGCRLHFKG